MKSLQINRRYQNHVELAEEEVIAAVVQYLKKYHPNRLHYDGDLYEEYSYGRVLVGDLYPKRAQINYFLGKETNGKYKLICEESAVWEPRENKN